VGVELVVKPAMVLLLAEPKSGLDRYSVVQLCQVLKKVTNVGSSEHDQPASSEIFTSFDGMILINEGRVMHDQ
jgi:ABC-type multidrug transport system ATPase subunit